jgi:phosphoribosyl 1,2-cyclic phosphodiesterase
MALRFISLGSGSRGNALLVESAETRLLVDCGFAARTLESRLIAAGVEPASIRGILVTHEHGDHVRGLGTFARRYRMPVWATPGTLSAGGIDNLPKAHLLDPHAAAFNIADLQIQTFPTPHDARESVQFLFRQDDARLGLLTDLGHVTAHIAGLLHDCDALVLEANHDTEMLANGDYHPQLKRRVGSRYGHLSNRQAAEFLATLAPGRLRHLWLAHVSENNNSAELAQASVRAAVPAGLDCLQLLEQDQASPWYRC